MRFLFTILVVLATALPVRAEPLSVEIIGTDPPAGARVPKGSALYVHLRYRSDAPIRVQVKGFFQGIEVTDGVRWNPSPPNPAGSGEAIAWLAFSRPARLDELRVEVSDPKWQPLVVLEVPRKVEWTGTPGEPRRAEWVRRLSDLQQQATGDGMAAIGEGSAAWLLGMLVMFSAPGYFVLQILLALRWSGGWRIAALAPLIIMAPAVGHALFAFAAASNLWPIAVILAAPFALLYLVLVALAKYLSGMLRPATA